MTDGEEDVCIYEVKSGDSLSGIAAQFGYITPTQIARINRLSLIGCGLPPVFPGQKLIVPTINRGSTVPVKTRPHVHSFDSSSGLDNKHCTGGKTDRTFSLPTHYTALEAEFIKVHTYRVMSDGKLVEGILLITPDLLCFDVAGLALFRKKFKPTTASHPFDSTYVQQSNNKSEMDNSADVPKQDEYSAPPYTIPEELLKLGFSIPLEQFTSMFTLKNLDGLDYPQAGEECSELSDHGTTTFPLDPENVVPSPVLSGSGTELSASSNIPELHNVDSSTTSLSETHTAFQSPSIDGATDAPDVVEPLARLPCVSAPVQMSVYSSSFQPTVETAAIAVNTPRLLMDHTSTTTVYSNNLKDYVYLRLCCSSGEAEAGEECDHIFRLTLHDLAQVHAFLMRAGLGADNRPRHEQKITEDDETVGRRSSTSGSNNVSPRRSLICEALDNMENCCYLPNLTGGSSGILTEKMLVELSGGLPSHWIGADFGLVYKTEKDGYSLKTLYRKSKEVTGGVLLLIRDTMGTVFGAIMSEKPHHCQHFYGTGETSVFHFAPEFKRYDWTKKNNFFMFGSLTSFQIGGQSGRNAIWFDEALKYGRSEPTDTFDNPVLSGSLPEFRLDSLTMSQAGETLLETSDQQTNPGIDRPPLTTYFPDNTKPHTETYINPSDQLNMDSVPFLIDLLELWEFLT